MSYDVWLTIDTGGPKPAEIADCGNMTSNVAPVWRAVGADVADFHGKLAKDCIPYIRRALEHLTGNPRSFDQYVRGDGSGGTVESAIEYLERLLTDFRAHPLATVRVSR